MEKSGKFDWPPWYFPIQPWPLTEHGDVLFCPASDWALLDTHDSLTDWYKHFRTRGQMQRTLKRLGLEEISCHYGGNVVEA